MVDVYYSSDDSGYEYGSDQYLSDEEEDYVYPWPTSSDDSWASISSEEAIQKILLKLPTYDPPDSDEGGNEFPDPAEGLEREDSIIEHGSDEALAAAAEADADAGGAEANAELAALSADGTNVRKIELGKNGPMMDQFLELYEGFRMLVHPDDVAEFDGYLEEGGPGDEMEDKDLTTRASSRSRTASLMVETQAPVPESSPVTESESSPVETPVAPEIIVDLKKQLEEQQQVAREQREKKKRIRAESRAKKPRKKEAFKIGDTVEVRDLGRGVIRWFGKAKVGDSSQKLIGVELNEPNGDSNGILEGTAYFKCKAKKGKFVKPSQVRKIQVRHVKVARENRKRKDARLFGDFYDNLMTDRIRRRRRKTKETVPTKLGPRDIGRVKGWKGGDEEYKDVLKIAAKGDFLDDRTAVRPKTVTTPVAKKSGPRDVGHAKDYEMPDFKIDDDGGDFLEERRSTRKKKKSTDESKPVQKKLGPRDFAHAKPYKAPDYRIDDDGDDFLSARTGRKTKRSSMEAKVERKPGPRDIWKASKKSSSSKRLLLSEDEEASSAASAGSARRSTTSKRKRSGQSRSRDSSPVGGMDENVSFDIDRKRGSTVKRLSASTTGSKKSSAKRSSGSSSRKSRASSSQLGEVHRSPVKKKSGSGISTDGSSSSTSSSVKKKKRSSGAGSGSARQLKTATSASDLLESGAELPELSEDGTMETLPAATASKKKRSSRSRDSGPSSSTTAGSKSGSSLAKPKKKKVTKSVG